MAAVAECNQQSYNFQPLCMTNFYAMDSDSTLTMTQLNAFHDDDGDSNRLPLQNRATKNSSDTFVERYKSELRCLQNPVNKWMTSHPEHWRSCEVIDWLYYCAHLNSIDCRVFKAEAFQDKLGQDLCLMNEGQFQELDPIYGKQIFDTFQRFLHTSSFVPSVCYIVHRDVRHTDPFGLVWGLVFAVARLVILCFCTRNKWIIQEDERNLELTFSNDPVNISSENSYTDLISVDNFSVLESHNTGNQTILNQNKNAATGKWGSHVSTHVSYMHTHIPEATSCTNIYDSTGSESVQGSTSSGESSPQYCQPYNLASTPRVYCSSLPTDPAYHTTSLEEVPIPTDDKSCAMATNLTVVSERKQTRGRRSGHGSKGTHLWEFIRDLLHDDKFCPGLIKWEDPDMGVFRFVQSEAVAKMWGQKKNNTSMTYEKLSRAMRYYYKRGILVRVDGRRLVYKFGPRSYGWNNMYVNAKLCS